VLEETGRIQLRPSGSAPYHARSGEPGLSPIAIKSRNSLAVFGNIAMG
jgi:hypothetical protein